MFNPATCLKEIWCGNGDKPDNYKRIGTRHSCMKKGYGRGYWDVTTRHLPADDLFHVPYMSQQTRRKLLNVNVANLPDFINLVKSFNGFARTKTFIEGLGYRSAPKFNAMVFFLFKKGVPVNKLPQCKN